jgi:hypothetical protein
LLDDLAAESPDDVFARDPLGLDTEDRRSMGAAIRALEPSWVEPMEPIRLPGMSWLPTLVGQNGALCHVHAAATLGRAWLRRMQKAREVGHDVAVAAPLAAWQFHQTLRTLTTLEVRPIVLEGDRASGWQATAFRSVAEMIAMLNLGVDPDTLRDLGNLLLDRALAARGSNERGDRFKDFLCLLFSQVPYLEVFQHNFENETEEIDLVLINRRVGQWAAPFGPLVMVSAKNTTGAVGAPALRSLYAKMANRRGQCRLGFLCASGRFADTVAQEDLRHSRGDSVVVHLDGQELRRLLIHTERLGELVEELVIGAALR